MKYFKYLYLSAAFLLFPSFVQAQELSYSERIKFNLDVLRTLEEYESSATLNSEENVSNFKGLFEYNEQQSIYNDLLGVAAPDSVISLNEYTQVLHNSTRAQSLSLKNLQKSEPYFKDGEWRMDVSFDKSMQYTNTCGILFDSEVHYGSDYHIEATLAWKQDERVCVFRKLTGSQSSEIQPLPAQYDILSTTGDLRDKDLKANGESVFFNSFGQAYLPYNAKITYPLDEDLAVKKILDNRDCNLYRVKYTPHHWRVKAHFDFNVSDMSNFISNEMPNMETKVKSSNNMGIDIGYIFPSGGHVKWGIFLGAGLAQTEIESTLDSYSFGYTDRYGHSDIDNDSYERSYEMENLKNTIKLTDLTVPLYIDMDVKFNKYFSMYLDAGVRMYMNMKTDAANFEGTFSTYGIYPQYNNLRLDWTSGLAQFANNAQIADNRNVNIDSEVQVEKISLDAMGSLGFRVRLASWIYLDLGATYTRSFLKPIKSDDSSASYALFEYSSAEQREFAHNLGQVIKEWERSSVSLNAGILFKF